mmetsp:Transcript_19441/g.21622  ORF Transcript_19441/g.21622 Transcript_19441/m.21622 type:complete len:171 (+) Transcript_19441:328-840(+)
MRLKLGDLLKKDIFTLSEIDEVEMEGNEDVDADGVSEGEEKPIEPQEREVKWTDPDFDKQNDEDELLASQNTKKRRRWDMTQEWRTSKKRKPLKSVLRDTEGESSTTGLIGLMEAYASEKRVRWADQPPAAVPPPEHVEKKVEVTGVFGSALVSGYDSDSDEADNTAPVK